MKIILASFLLVACGSAEQAAIPEVPNIVVATPTPVPTPAPIATPTPSPEAQATEALPDNSEALYAAADAQWHVCIRNAVSSCGRQPAGYSPAFERCKNNATSACGSEPVLTDF